MAIRKAAASGNWSAVGTWDGGATLPQAGDDVYLNNFIVTLDMDTPALNLLSNNVASGITNGGRLEHTGATARVVNATTLFARGASGTQGLILHNGSGALTVNFTTATGGSASGGSDTNQAVVNCTTGTGTLTLNGTTLTGGAGSNNNGLTINGAAVHTVVVNCNVVGGTGASDANGIKVTATSGLALTLNGNATGGSATGIGGACGVLFSVTAGVAFEHNGTATASTNQCAILAGLTNGGTSNMSARLSGPFVDASNGRSAIVLPHYYLKASPWQTDSTHRDDSLGHAAIVMSTHPSGTPSAANVRLGTTYGSGGGLTGTLAVPAASSVAYGVAVDATTGTAVLTPTAAENAVWNALLSGHTTTGTAGKKLGDLANLSAQNVWDLALTSADDVAGSVGERLSILARLTDLPTVPTTAQITAAVWSALRADLTTANSIGKYLKNASTVDVTAEQIANSLDQG